MNRTLLNLITWGTIVSAVVCALLLAAAVDDLDPSVRAAPVRPAAARLTPEPKVGSVAPQGAERPSALPEPSSLRLADRD